MAEKLFLDCSSGISGDMFSGALIDLGFDINVLRKELSKLKLDDFKVSTREVSKKGVRALKFDVHIHKHQHHHRTYKDIEAIYKKSSLDKKIISRALDVFKVLADAEALVHGTTRNKVHFHEVGAVDSIVDITTVAAGIHYLGITDIACSPLNLGGGMINMEHGRLPVPAPATAELLKGVPVYSGTSEGELTTPTGAALVKVLCSEFISFPSGIISKIGYGAGEKELHSTPNILRAFLLESEATPGSGYDKDTVIIIETNIDDQNPQCFEYVMEKLFEKGALDVYLTPIIMKKSRPAIMLSVISGKEKCLDLIESILTETTSFGVRYYEVPRIILQREIRKIKTRFGMADIKLGIAGGKILKVSPEYESIKELARKSKKPILEVIREVQSVIEKAGIRKGR